MPHRLGDTAGRSPGYTRTMRRSTVLLLCVPVMPVVATSYPIDAQAAIRNVMGREPLISCNEMDRTANGILFNGVAYGTDVRGNFFHDHKWPLHLDATAIIDVQVLKGNLWDPGAATPVVGALYEDTLNASNYPFYYDPATINGGNTQPPSWSPTNWFNFTFGTNYDCADHHGMDYCSQFEGERDTERLTGLDVRVANDSLENDPYTDESKWMLKSGLYKKLDENPELQDSLQVMADLYDELQGSTTSTFKGIDDSQEALYDLDSNVVVQLRANSAQIDSLAMLVQGGLEQLGDSTLSSAQREAILAGLNGYREDIRDLSAWSAATLQAASSSKAQSADIVQATNAGIAIAELIEENQKTVSEIYLATIGKDVDIFSTTQAGALFDIANQCPMIGGNAVFKARSLYWLIDDSYDFDDPLLCLSYGIVVKSLTEREANAISVIPNPARDEASLVMPQELKDPGTLIMYDALGAEVLRSSIPAETMRFAFSTTALSPALYHYKVLTVEGVIGAGKLTILR